MIASHNTFSYMKSSWLMERFSKYWRCQNISAKEQAEVYHVDVCDIRVKYHKGHWRLCHGKAMFGEKYSYLEHLIKHCLNYGFKSYRLMYESNDSGYYKFLTEFYGLPSWMRSCCIAALNKPKWDCVYGSINAIQEHNKHIWYNNKPFWKNIINLFYPSIKEYAVLNNVLPEKEDDNIYMFDYVQYLSHVK